MIRICLLIVCVVVTPLGAAQSDPRRADAGKRIAAVLPKPSVNQGKVGVYAATTSRAGYNYYVGVPKAVSETNPAGIHVFFHGLGGQAMARDFMLWAEFLKLTNCIGINMEYTDGNPHEDMDGKAEAAREAVLQVTADYPVIPGLGAITALDRKSVV